MNIYNSRHINKPITSINACSKSKKLLNFDDSMYKYKQDSINVEEAKSYVHFTKSKINEPELEASKPISNSVNSTIKYSNNDYCYLTNHSVLKSTCSKFKQSNNIQNSPINYLSPEILLQASYLNSIYAFPHVIKDNTDES